MNPSLIGSQKAQSTPNAATMPKMINVIGLASHGRNVAAAAAAEPAVVHAHCANQAAFSQTQNAVLATFSAAIIPTTSAASAKRPIFFHAHCAACLVLSHAQNASSLVFFHAA